MSLNTSNIPDFTGLNQSEIIQEYEKLFEHHQQLKRSQDEDKQKIYELTRTLNTANATEAYLSNELELVVLNQSAAIEKIQQKHNHEIDVLKKNHSELQADYSSLQKQFDDLQKCNEKLTQNITELENHNRSSSSINSSLTNESKLEKENLELLAEIDDCHYKIKKMTLETVQQENNVGILKEKIEFLEENLQFYRNQFEEKSNLLEKAQEKVIELKSELVKPIVATPENNNKGNSLFAEVDDQRQAMKKMLSDQKQHFMEMKKKYNESQYEIRRLKRENSALHNELQICSTIFLGAQKTYKEKLNERINQLLRENERLEKKLAWTQDKLIRVSSEQGINLIDSMLKFCKEETENLQEQLHCLHIQKGLLEANLENSQEELAKWRFETLKLRCILAHRECLLEEHNIEFEASACSDFKLNEAECEKAIPNISFNRNIFNAKKDGLQTTVPNDQTLSKDVDTHKIDLQADESKIKEENDFAIYEDSVMHASTVYENKVIDDVTEIIKKEDVVSPQSTTIVDEIQSNNFNIYEDTTMNVMQLTSKPIMETKFDEKENFCNVLKPKTVEKQLSKTDSSNSSTMETSLQNHFSVYEDFQIVDCLPQSSSILKENFESNKTTETETKKSSILVQNRDILDFTDEKKSVKFDESAKQEQKSEEGSSSLGTVVKKIRSKPDIVVRRIQLKPRGTEKK